MSILYHHTASAASRFVRISLEEAGHEATLAEERIWERRPAFVKLNPAVTLPVLVASNGHALCGAFVISEWLDESYGAFKRERRLLADDPFKRAEIRRLVEWFLVKFEQDVTRPLVRERIMKMILSPEDGGGSPDPKALRTGRANIRQHMKYLGWLAGTRAWLAGDRMSYADLAAGAALSLLDYLGEIDWSENPEVKDWYQRIKSRPSFRPLLADRIRGLAPVAHYGDLDF